MYNVSGSAAFTSPKSPINMAFSLINSTFMQGAEELDTANVANPFQSIGTCEDVNSTELTLVDGGIGGEVIPIAPLLAKARGVDVIFSVDGVSDFFSPASSWT